MTTVPRHEPATSTILDGSSADAAASLDSDRLKQVPALRADRERIRRQATAAAETLDRSRAPGRRELEANARAVLADLGLPEAYLGWTMVALSSAYWRDEVIGIAPQRRLLLLPHCMRNTNSCPAEYDASGLLCQGCGECALAGLRSRAERLGYRVLVAEGSPVVVQILLAGEVDAVLGVACLNSLEKAFEKLLLVGLPSMAVPLLTDSCRDSTSDMDWVEEMIGTPYEPRSTRPQTYVHLLRTAVGMFRREELDRLVPPRRAGSENVDVDGDGQTLIDPVAEAEALARDFLVRGGKHLRPFITLAAYDAMTGAGGLGRDGAAIAARLPDAVRRIAVAIEVFHKASLVHDDLEDEDGFRYGRPTLHQTHGVARAVNVGDYLIGLGYRLVAAQQDVLGTETVADILARLSEAHTRLCEGQGAELAWQAARARPLEPIDALRIYALKTAPAFEAALYAGLRMAGPAEPYREAIARFARHLGVAFQILNDLDDGRTVATNHRSPSGDLVHHRPTILWALAHESLNEQGRGEMESLAALSKLDDAALERVGRLYDEADVYRKAESLVAKHHGRACEIADQIEHDGLRRLLHYFADTMIHA